MTTTKIITITPTTNNTRAGLYKGLSTDISFKYIAAGKINASKDPKRDNNVQNEFSIKIRTIIYL